jgi:CRP-like cAMP-binding protein
MNPTDACLPQLKNIPFFAGLPERQLAVLAQASCERSYKKDTFVFMKGDRPTGLFAVVSGTIKMACQSPQGEERVIDLIGPGQVFGEAALLLDCPYPYLTAALTPARLLHVDGGALHKLVDASPTFSQRMLSRLSHGIVAVMRDLEDYRVHTPRERVIRFLLDQRNLSHPATGQARQSIAFPAPKHVFASLLGMTPESLSRSMRDLAEAGLIEVGKTRVKVLDRQRLAYFLS